MIIYSSKIIHFINEIKTAIRRILSDEIRLKVMSERFLDRKMESSYPIKAVIYNHKKMLGYFDPEFYELGFHERKALENIHIYLCVLLKGKVMFQLS